MILTNIFSSKILNSKTGLIKEITQWLPEYDDPRIYVMAALTSNVEYLGLQKLGSTLNSGASTDKNGAIWAAIGESLERYCSAIIPENLILCSYNDLKEKAVHPKRFQFYSNEQYTSVGFPFERFTETTCVTWVEAAELATGDLKYVPASTVYLPYFAKKKGESNIWAPVSTGLACASTPSQAVLSGLYEVIERDAFMLFWLLGRNVKKLDWESNNNLSNFIYKYFRYSIDYIHLLDITSDVNVPTVLGIYHKPGEGLLVSAATRSTFLEASKKALLELAQGRITWRKTFEEYARISSNVQSYNNIRTFEDHVQLFTNPKMVSEVPFIFSDESISLDCLQSTINSNLSQVGDLSTYLKEIGYQCYCINLTVDEVNETRTCVYRSLIPGLIEISNDHVWQRLGENRIINYYESMRGREFFNYTPDYLNPVPHPFP